ncbi:MAG TPA: FAD-binding oxidoreductase [Thermomicrobiales bacterium]|nr:FAD-binding oxidoreductase [Thermomicrobiales bacterium]
MVVATRPSTSSFTVVSPETPLDELRSKLVGQLLTADSIEYEQARRTQNLKSNRFPKAIVRAASEYDVSLAVAFAREQGLPLAVRSGGHSLALYSVVDDALVIDLSGMKRVRIDPDERIAYVQPGATSGDLAVPAGEHGLALSTGDARSVGMGGLTTGGGIGFMVRKYGLAIDNLLAARVVLADGSIVTTSATERPDLFWAIRGGGGNFGIITEFTYRLAPVGQIYGGALILPATKEVIRGYLDYAKSAPEDLTTITNMMFAPPAPFIPEDKVGSLVLIILPVWTGSMEDGEKVMAPLRALAEPVADLVGPMPYPAIYTFTDFATEPHGAALRSMFSDDLSDDAIDAILDAMATASSPFALVQLRPLGGALSKVEKYATAFAHRDKDLMLAIINIWLDPAEDSAPHAAWTEALWAKVRGEGEGAYVNFLEEEGEARIRDAYPPATYEKLAKIKAYYDPENVFRFNQNIKPSA